MHLGEFLRGSFRKSLELSPEILFGVGIVDIFGGTVLDTFRVSESQRVVCIVMPFVYSSGLSPVSLHTPWKRISFFLSSRGPFNVQTHSSSTLCSDLHRNSEMWDWILTGWSFTSPWRARCIPQGLFPWCKPAFLKIFSMHPFILKVFLSISCAYEH